MIILRRFLSVRFIFLLAIIGFIVYGVVQCNSSKVTAEPDYLKKTPDTAYFIPTDSRIYYMNDYTETVKGITLHNYYEYNGKKWVFIQRNLPLIQAHFVKELKVREN